MADLASHNVGQVQIYDGAGQAVVPGTPYKTGVLDITGRSELKVFAEFTYHGSATKGGRVDIIPIQPDGATEETDEFVTAVTPSFAAGGTKSKTSSPINVTGLNKIKLAVVNEDATQNLTLKKLYLR